MPEDVWLDNSIQYPRLLSEVYAVMQPGLIYAIALSMDLPMSSVKELFDRAEADWESIKARTVDKDDQ